MTITRLCILVGATLAGIGACIAVSQFQPVAAQSANVPAAAGQSTAGHAASAPAPAIRFTTLPGFTIERVVPASNTDSYVVITFDSRGRLVVSKEFDNPRALLDRDGDGVFESEQVITDKVKNCQGLWFDGPTLYGACAPADAPVAQGPGAPAVSGVYMMQDTNGDGVADTFETFSTVHGGIQEHGPHAIRRGPDGLPTLSAGNNTFVPDELIDPMSPLRGDKESQLLPALPDGRGFGPSVKEGLHGTLSRIDVAHHRYVLLFGGIRNAYDHAYNLAGEMFTFDSDMEWDINMPWYRAVRSVHAIPGGNYGYRNGSGKFPPYYLDSLPPMRDVGRGSPVGVEFYQHTAYPAQFHDAYFEADWSRGRLLWTPLERTGATYKTTNEKEEFVHGEPLNITDIEVGPDGMLYFSTGGRGTEGGIYRVRYTGAPGAASTPAPSGVLAIVRQPQPLSSWGYAALEQKKASMGEAWGRDLAAFAKAANAGGSASVGASGEDRAQAVLMLQRHGPQPNADLLKTLAADRDVNVRAAAVYVAGAQGSAGSGTGSADAVKAIAASALKDADPWVRRRAAEALVRLGLSAEQPSFAPVADIFHLLDDADRFVRYAGRLALEWTPRAAWKDLALNDTSRTGGIESMVALVDTATSDSDLEPVFKKQLAWLAKTDIPVDDELRLLRAFQLAAINAKQVRPDLRTQVHALLIKRFPAQDERLSRQLALTLAWAGQPETIGKIMAAMPQGDTNPQLQIHYVYALRTMTDGWTAAQKAQLVDWYAKASTWRGGASFQGFINLLFDASLQTFNADEKKLAYAKVPQFAPLTETELAAIAQRQTAQRAASRQNPATTRTRGVAMISREEILQEQIFTPQRTPPSVADGRKTFETVCAACHRFGSIGNDIGPDLTTVSSRFQKRDMLEAILWPSKTISDQYQLTTVETADASTVSGFLVQQDDQKVTLRTPDTVGRSIDIPRARIKSLRKSPVSLMPEGLVDQLSQQEIASLMAFLQASVSSSQ
jgi:putative heme-binding domain-containing protein